MDGLPAAAAVEGSSKRGTVAMALAGLQAGMLGVLWMLVWLGITSTLQQRTFWSAENLFATAAYGGDAIRSGIGKPTFFGFGLYVVLYCLLGAAFAAAAQMRLSRVRTLFAALAFSLAWYFASFHWIWKSAIPLAYLLHPEQPTILGHLIYGTFLGRFQIYLVRPRPTPPPSPALPPAIQPGHNTGPLPSATDGTLPPVHPDLLTVTEPAGAGGEIPDSAMVRPAPDSAAGPELQPGPSTPVPIQSSLPPDPASQS